MPFALPAPYFPIAYAIFLGLGLALSLIVGVRLHLKQLVETHCHVYNYVPSISATTGDVMPERAIWRTSVCFGFGVRMTCGLLLYQTLLMRVRSTINPAILAEWARAAAARVSSPAQRFAAPRNLPACLRHVPIVSSACGLLFHFVTYLLSLLFCSCSAPIPGASPSSFLVMEDNPESGNNNGDAASASASRTLSSSSQAVSATRSLNLVHVMYALSILQTMCGLGWTFIASSENLLVHEVFFGVYIAIGFFVQVFQVVILRRTRATSASGILSFKLKVFGLVGQTLAAAGVVRFFIEHNATCAPGVYSLSTMCEWVFAFFNLFFDLTLWLDLEGQVVVFGGTPAATATGASWLSLSVTEVPATTNNSSGEKAEAEEVASPIIASEKSIVYDFFDRYPSPVALWCSDLVFGYLYWAVNLHLMQAVYFIPMVAMHFTAEVGLVVAPIATVMYRFSFIQRKMLGLSSSQQSAAAAAATHATGLSKPLIVCLAASLISLFSIDASASAERKLLVLGIGATFLNFAVHGRFYSMSILSAVNVGSNGAAAASTLLITDPHVHKWFAEAKERVTYMLPLGVVVQLLVRMFNASLDPFFAFPMYNLVGLLVCAAAVFVYVRQLVTMRKHVEWAMASALGGGGGAKKSSPTSIGAFAAASSCASIVVLAPSSSASGIRPRTQFAAPHTRGVMFAALVVLTQMLLSTHGSIARFLGFYPFASGIFVTLTFVLGIASSGDLIERHSKAGASQQKYRRTVCAAVLASLLVFYYGCWQSNRMLENPNTPLITSNNMVDPNIVRLENWHMEKFGGSSMLAHAAALALVYVLGMLWPCAVRSCFGLAYTVGLTSSASGSSEKMPSDATAPSPLSPASPASHAAALTAQASMRIGNFELTSFLVRMLLIMMNVYVVCYPFVPGGFLMRDRFNVILLSCGSCLCFGLLKVPDLFVPQVEQHVPVRAVGAVASPSQQQQQQHSAAESVVPIAAAPSPQQPPQQHSTQSSMHVFNALLTMLGLLLFVAAFRTVTFQINDNSAPGAASLTSLDMRLRDFFLQEHDKLMTERKQHYDSQVASGKPKSNVIKPFLWSVKAILKLATQRAAVRIFGGNLNDRESTRDAEQHLSALQRKMLDDITPISGGVWAIHWGQDNYGADSFETLTNTVRKHELDVIALLESDGNRLQNGMRDIVEYMSERLGFRYSDYGPTTMDSTFGCAIITKFPILRVERQIMPSPVGELACNAHVWLDVYGEEVQVHSAHFGNTDHRPDLILQSQHLAQSPSTNPGNAIFLGYITSRAEQGHYKTIVKCKDGSLGCTGPWLDTGYYLKSEFAYVDATEEFPGAKMMTKTPRSPYTAVTNTENRMYRHLWSDRVTDMDPLFNFLNRYCEYILWHPKEKCDGGAAQENAETAPGTWYKSRACHKLELFDWLRDDLPYVSDTELQIAKFFLKPSG